jgi:hypothetical protein
VVDKNAGERVPALNDKALSVASVLTDAALVTVTVYVWEVAPSPAVTISCISLEPTASALVYPVLEVTA